MAKKRKPEQPSEEAKSLGIKREERVVRTVELMPRFGFKRTREKVSKITLAKVTRSDE